MGSIDPWQDFAQRHRRDERITGPITKTTDFGLFVALEGGIEGIVHLGDLSWLEPGEAAIRWFAEGDLVETQILSIDVYRQRISLGIKQIDSPFDAFADRFAAGDSIVGRVREVGAGKLVVELPGGLAGIVRLSEGPLSFQVGDQLTLVIEEIWPRHGLIKLKLDDDDDDSSSVPVEPTKPPSPKPLSTSRNQ